jgi:hypothetical protein
MTIFMQANLFYLVLLTHENMSDVIKDIGRLYSTKQFFVAFLILVVVFQILAFYTYGSFYWYLGDYFWYMFIFVVLVDVIILARRAARRSYAYDLERRLVNYKENFLDGLKLDNLIFDVEPSDIAIINDKPIKVEGRKEHMVRMREFLDIIKHINEKIKDKWPDVKDQKEWLDKTDAQIFAELKVKKTDIEAVAKSKESLKFWLASYNANLKKLRELEKGFESTYEKGMIAITPVVLLVTIAFQLGNVTNKLLFHVFGG